MNIFVLILLWQHILYIYVLPDDDERYAIETCRSSESVLKKWFKINDIQLVRLLVVRYLVNLQDARCNNKDNEYVFFILSQIPACPVLIFICSVPWLNGNLTLAEKCSGPLRFRLRQVLLYYLHLAATVFFFWEDDRTWNGYISALGTSWLFL